MRAVESFMVFFGKETGIILLAIYGESKDSVREAQLAKPM